LKCEARDMLEYEVHCANGNMSDKVDPGDAFCKERVDQAANP